MLAARRALQATRGYATSAQVQIPLVLHGIDGRYATALYTAAAKKQALDTVENDLKQVKRVVEKDTKLRDFLENPTINRIEKKSGVQKMLAAGKYNDLTKNFFDTLAENGRLNDTVKIIDSYGSLMSAHRGEVQVTITSAKELDAKDIAKVKGYLAKSAFVTSKQTLVVSNKVNPSILGGLVVEFGDKTIDLSVSSKVNKLNQLLSDPSDHGAASTNFLWTMEDIRLEDEPVFEPFDSYEDFADEMMLEAERQDQLMAAANGSTSGSGVSAPQSHLGGHTGVSSSSDILPQRQDFLGMLKTQNQAADLEEQKAQQQRQQQKQQQQQQQQRGGPKGKASRPIGSIAGGADDDSAAVNVTKKRFKPVTLDTERLLSDVGLPLLMSHGKRFKIRSKYKNHVEKNANAKQNLADLMRLYQTWAHNLFPKSTFKDFITLAESRCAKDKQIRATMDGWRRAYWDDVKEKKQAKEDAEGAEQETEGRINGVWDEHEKELQARSAGDMDYEALGPNDGDPSSSARQALSSTSAMAQKQQQPRPKPNISRKGKERAVDDPVAAMRQTVSDDEDQEDYEAALNRMRISMNRNSKPDDERIPDGQNHAREREETPEPMRKYEIDIDNYNSDVEDDEDEEDAPLFTHRALQMMGGLKALEAQNKSTDALKHNQSNDVQGMNEDADLNPIESTEQATIELTQSRGDNADDLDHAMGREMVDEGDEDDMPTSQKPPKTRRTIVLGDSDEE
ncbi:ATP synthase F0 subcomplex subunit OSCP atp5 [Mortierella sp. NVP85]|nr:ATP synthase F0 subcomplex subunit OSCP atp5 [Mortierella sp. NVP85]